MNGPFSAHGSQTGRAFRDVSSRHGLGSGRRNGLRSGSRATVGALATWLGFETAGGSIEVSPGWGLIAIGMIYGLASGTVISLLPAAVAAAVVTTVLVARHPGPTSEEG